MSGLVKRSLTIAGHRTSIRLEPAFWDGLKQLAAQRGLSLPALIAAIDEQRSAPLASALRLAVLAHYRERARAADSGECN
jgi:predicted DNA-binding ribbon-helix-helix protein